MEHFQKSAYFPKLTISCKFWRLIISQNLTKLKGRKKKQKKTRIDCYVKFRKISKIGNLTKISEIDNLTKLSKISKIENLAITEKFRNFENGRL